MCKYSSYPFHVFFFLFPRTAQFSRTPVTVNANWLTNGSHQSNRLAMFVLLIRETTKRTGFFDCFSLRFASHSLCSPLLSSLPCAFHTFPSVYFHLSFPINTPLSDSCNSPSAGRRLKGLNSFSFIAFFFFSLAHYRAPIGNSSTQQRYLERIPRIFPLWPCGKKTQSKAHLFFLIRVCASIRTSTKKPEIINQTRRDNTRYLSPSS